MVVFGGRFCQPTEFGPLRRCTKLEEDRQTRRICTSVDRREGSSGAQVTTSTTMCVFFFLSCDFHSKTVNCLGSTGAGLGASHARLKI